MKISDKKHLIKSFLIFFISLEILNIIVFNFYYNEQRSLLKNSIFSQLKTYNYNFENKNISMNIASVSKNKEKYKLYIDKKEIYAYFDLLGSNNNLLKLSYDYKLYEEEINNKLLKILGLFIIISIILFIYSFFYSVYTLKPYKSAVELLKRFLRDIIHDLNTPISSILINTSILKKNYNLDAVNRIELSGKTISNLYKNLEQYISNSKFDYSHIDLLPIIKQRVDYFRKLFPQLSFSIDENKCIIKTNEIAITRIIDNIISNSCKYNKKDGSIKIILNENRLIIKDTGYGIKNPQKAFDRFYKESDRGMGIGLNIVKKIANEINIEVSLNSIVNEGTEVILNLKKGKNYDI